jgi:hypothetical protein
MTEMRNPVFLDPRVVERDRWGRPLIVPPGETKAVGYSRVTSFVGAPEDTYVLNVWEQHQLMDGLAHRPDLILSAFAHRDNWGRLEEIREEALEATLANTRATIGTALHLLCDQVDGGQVNVRDIPDPWRADVEMYLRLTEGWEWVAREEFRVYDKFRVAGTADRRGYDPADGVCRIVDLKTGRIDSSPQKIAGQLRCYAKGVTYDLDTHERGPEGEVDEDKGVVVHVPAEESETANFILPGRKPKKGDPAGLWYVDLGTIGAAHVELSAAIKDWRRVKDVFSPYTQEA